MSRQTRIIITCEHGGNRVPPEYHKLFRGKHSALQSHRGLDRGALELARVLAATIKAPLFASTITRLLVDLNRSPHHRQLFSDFTRNCEPAVKTHILENYYYPYRTKVENEIHRIARSGATVLHFSIHSFTPGLGGVLRRADVGLLYDPQRPGERDLCRRFQTKLGTIPGGLIVRRNYPYRGVADGFTTYLRSRFGKGKYLGIEIEINQKLAGDGTARWHRLLNHISRSVKLAVPV